MTIQWPFKDPNEVLDYAFNWTPRNIGLIVTSTATVISGTVVVDSHGVATVKDPATGVNVATGKGTQTWLSGGTLDETCSVLLEAHDDGGRIVQQTVTVKIKAR